MRFTLLAVLAIGTVSSPVRAETLWFDNYCSTGAFQVCASVRLVSEGTTLRMQVWNLHGTLGVPHTMTAIGLYHSGAAWTGRLNSYTVSYDGADISSYWTPKAANDIRTLGGVRLELQEGTQGNRGIVGCADPGGPLKWRTCQTFPNQPYVEFTFRLSQHFDLAGTDMRWHSQQLPDGSSVKCDTGGNGDYPPCIPFTPVPEPSTILLFATGLAGLFGIGFARRTHA